MMALSGRKIPMYGDGSNVREWIHVADHCRGIALALLYGKSGEIYNIGSGVELTNLEIAQKILMALDVPNSQLEFVADRKGHDYRYSVNYQKIETLGYEPKEIFDESLALTIKWFKQNYLDTQS
jgi:dTDP-glucose 4,6-dehydratase